MLRSSSASSRRPNYYKRAKRSARGASEYVRVKTLAPRLRAHAYSVRNTASSKSYARSGYGRVKGYSTSGVGAGAGAALGGLAGAALGGPLGAAIGTPLGAMAGDAFARLTGYGSYSVKRNVLLNEGLSPPRIRNRTSAHATTVRHREYVQDITSHNAFTLLSFALNPGQSETFPWLAQLAANYEEFDIEGMIFEFKSLASDAPTASFALGSVIMATSYNASNPNFQNKQQMENYEFASSCKPSCSMLHPIECDPHQNPISELYVRTGSVPAGQDQRLYDLGNFQIAVVGMPTSFNGQVIGELWCSYQIALYKPKLVSGLGLELSSYHAQLDSASTAAPLGLSQVLDTGNNLSLTIDPTGSILSWPVDMTEGTFLVQLNWIGGSTSTTVPTVTPSANMSPVNLYTGGTANGTSAPQGGATGITQLMTSQIWKITGLNPLAVPPSLSYVGNSLPLSITSADLIVTQINGNLNGS